MAEQRRRRSRRLGWLRSFVEGISVHAVATTIVSVLVYFVRATEPAALATPIVAFVAGKLLLVFYVVLWVIATYTAVNALKALYSNRSNQPRRRVILNVILSVTTCIAGYAIAYLDLSASPGSFNVNAKLDGVSALYFSVVTFATVGYGDITPVGDLARLVVLSEIVIGMLYTVLIFSLIAGFIREESSKATH